MREVMVTLLFTTYQPPLPSLPHVLSLLLTTVAVEQVFSSIVFVELFQS